MKSDRYAAAYDRETWSQRANEIRARIPVSNVVGRVVELKKAGKEFVGLCPFHNESTPSFTVNDGKRFYHCFGCGDHGDAVGFVMKRQGLDFKAAVELLESENGLRSLQASRPAPPPPKVAQSIDVKKAEEIAAFWKECRHDPIVGRYLEGRNIPPPASYGIGDPTVNGGWPDDLRFHPATWHGGLKQRLPAMVAPFRRHDGAVTALHRTFLKVTGVGVTKAGTSQDKMHWGPRKGCFILLGPIAGKMVECEGIETTLSFMYFTKRSGFAAGSADALEAVEPPFLCDDLLIGADWSQTNRIGEQRANAARRKFATGGRTIGVKVPNLRHLPKADFNDTLQAAARVPAAASSTAGGGPAPDRPPTRRAPSLQSVAPPAVLSPSPAISRDEGRDTLRLLKCRQDEAWLAYAAAEEAVAQAVAGTPEWTASRAALGPAKAKWADACRRYEAAAQGRIA